MKPRVKVRNGKPLTVVSHSTQINQELVEHLEKLLELAKAGEMRGIVEIVEWWDGTLGNGWRVQNADQAQKLLGELFILQLKMLGACE